MTVRQTKSFTSKKDKLEPIPFELEGEVFEAYPKIAGVTLLEFIASSEQNTAATAAGILNYLKKSMSTDEYARFYALVSNPEKEIELETLSEIVSYLITEQSARPTPAS